MKNVAKSLRTIALLIACASVPMFAQDAAQTKAPAPRASQDANKPQKPTAPGSTATGAAAPATGAAKSWKQIAIPKLPPFKPQEPKRIQLANGMILFLQEDHELPTIDGEISIRGGASEVPPEKTGMMSVYGSTWRLGGTEKMTGDQMDDFLEARAARVSTGGGMELTSMSWSCLKGDFNDVFNLAVELLQHPQFRQDKIDLTKTQIKSGIARRNDDSGSIVGREMSKIAYGTENPYGRTAEYDTINAITRDDLLAFHKAHVYPNNMIVGVTGDFDSAQMEAALRKAFDSWPKGPEAKLPKFDFKNPKPGVYFAAKDDVNQSEVRMFHLGIEKTNPDLFAVDVMDQIFFSGGFSSRMMNDIRTKRGLAYAAGGSISAPYDHPGLVFLSVGTKSPTTVEAIKAVKELVANMDKQPATEEEMRLAKDSILNSFIFTVDSKDKILSERMTYEFYGFPADWLERYRAGIEKVTLDDVARVAKKYIHADQLATLVVGNPDEIKPPLNSLGEVTKLDISIPPPGSLTKNAGGKTAAPAAVNTPEAKALLAKALDALGGVQKLQQVKSVHTTSSDVAKTPMGDMNLQVDSTVVFPDKLRLVRETPQGTMTIVVGPSAAFASMPMGSQDLPASIKSQILDELKKNPVYVAQHVNDVSVALGADEKVGGVDAKTLDLNSGGVKVTWCIDPNSGRLLRTKAQADSPAGPVEQVVDLSDWKAIDGVMFAFTRKTSQNGQEAGGSTVKEVQVNPTVDPKQFEKQ